MGDSTNGGTFFSPERRELLAQLLQKKGIGVSPMQTIPKRDDSVLLPLSLNQEGLWFIDQLDPGKANYNIPGAVRLRGKLNVGTLEQSLNEIVSRHESLRTTFVMKDDGMVFQVIAPVGSLIFPVVDLERLLEPEREAEALRLATEDARKPFDLARGPLFRTFLLRLNEDEHVLILNIHHIVCDGWSMGVFTRELTALYKAFSSGKPSPLPKLPIQFADWALWEREWMQGAVLDARLSYWKKQLGGSLPVLQLPTDRPRPPIQSFRGVHQPIKFSKSLTDELRTFSQQEGVTLFMTLLAAFRTLLYRYTGQDDLVVGTGIANRDRSELEGLIGYFTTVSPIRTDLSGNPSFRECLNRVRTATLDTCAHNLPLTKLVKELKPKRDPSRNPLFQVEFTLLTPDHNPAVYGYGLSSEIETLELPDLTMTPLSVEGGIARYDLAVFVWDLPEGLSGTVEYCMDLFESVTITRMVHHFETLLHHVVAEPDVSLNELVERLNEVDRQQQSEFNITKANYPRNTCIHQLIEEQAKRTPDATAVLFEDRRLTYAELNTRANQLAHHLCGLGVRPEMLVGICVERSLDMMVGLLGILKAGGAYVPLDPWYPKERLAFMIEDARMSVLLTQNRFLQHLPRHGAHVVCLDTDRETIVRKSTANPDGEVTAENLAYVIYTSGSTGKPKGVQITHRNLVHSTTARIEYYREPITRFLLLSSYAFDSSIAGIFWTLCQGRTLVLPEEGVQMDPKQLGKLLVQHHISHILSLPSLYMFLLEEAQQLSSLKTVIVAGEACPRELVDRHHQLLPGTNLFNEYGPTECTVWSSVYHCEEQVLNAAVSIGRPIANTQIYLLNSRQQSVPIGVAGELYIGGEGLARCYLNRPELVAEQFTPHPFSDQPGARIYKTGDLAKYLPDGTLEFLGRIDNQVKIRGFRIEMEEIESLLIQHPAVAKVVVDVREDEPGDKRLVAYIEPEPGQAPTLSELHNFLGERLPDYMVPSAFVLLDAMPLMPNGKVDRRSLPAPDPARPELERPYEAPHTDVEHVLAEILSEVLGVEQVGIHDNFFELGGHSLLIIRLIARMRDALHIEVPVRAVFEAPTVAGLVEMILKDSDKGAKAEKAAYLLMKLAQLSEDEVETMFEQKVSLSQERGMN